MKNNNNKEYIKWKQNRKTKRAIAITGLASITAGAGVGVGYAVWHNSQNKPTPPTPPVTPSNPVLVPLIEENSLQEGKSDSTAILKIEEINVTTWEEPAVTGGSGLDLHESTEFDVEPLSGGGFVGTKTISLGSATKGTPNLSIDVPGFNSRNLYVTILPSEGEKAISATVSGYLQIDSGNVINITIKSYGDGVSEEIGAIDLPDGNILSIDSKEGNHATISLGSGEITNGDYSITVWNTTGEDTTIDIHIQDALPNPIPIGGNYATWNQVKDYFLYTTEIVTDQPLVAINGISNDSDLINKMNELTCDGIDFGDNVTTISNEAFANASAMGTEGNIKYLKFNHISDIGDYAFMDCTGLKQVYLGSGHLNSGQIEIGDNAFQGCSNLQLFGVAPTTFIIGMGDNAFQACGSLIRDFFFVTDRNLGHYDGQVGIGHWVNSYDGKGSWLIDSNSTKCLGKVAFGEIEIDALIEIEEDAFSACYGIKTVRPWDNSNLYTIGINAFAFCKNLISVEIPRFVLEISETAFYGCQNLSSFAISENEEMISSSISIGDSAFAECYSLSSISLPTAVTSIHTHAFFWCANLQSFIFYKDENDDENFWTVYFGAYLFEGCESLNSIQMANKTNVTDNGTFTGFYNTNGIIKSDSLSACKAVCKDMIDNYLPGYADIQTKWTWVGNQGPL